GSDTIFDELVEESREFPHWQDINFEFDLMVKKPHEKIPDFICMGASRIIVHKNSIPKEELEAIIRDYGKNSEDFVDDGMNLFNIEFGLGITNDTKPEEISDIVEKFHFVQIMGIDKIGFQGQEFNLRTVDLVKSLRQM